MFAQKKTTMITKTTTTKTRTKRATPVIESLEGRQLYSASPALAVDAAPAEGKVAVHDISFVARANKGSPEFSTQKVKFNDILISSKDSADFSTQKIKFSDILISSTDLADSATDADQAAGISIVIKVNKPSPK